MASSCQNFMRASSTVKATEPQQLVPSQDFVVTVRGTEKATDSVAAVEEPAGMDYSIAASSVVGAMVDTRTAVEVIADSIAEACW